MNVKIHDVENDVEIQRSPITKALYIFNNRKQLETSQTSRHTTVRNQISKRLLKKKKNQSTYLLQVPFFKKIHFYFIFICQAELRGGRGDETEGYLPSAASLLKWPQGLDQNELPSASSSAPKWVAGVQFAPSTVFLGN